MDNISPATRKDERVNIRVDAATKALLQKAAEISGSRLSEFLLSTALLRAQKLVSKPPATKLTNDEFCRLLDTIENPPEPTDYLVDAFRKAR